MDKGLLHEIFLQTVIRRFSPWIPNLIKMSIYEKLHHMALKMDELYINQGSTDQFLFGPRFNYFFASLGPRIPDVNDDFMTHKL